MNTLLLVAYALPFLLIVIIYHHRRGRREHLARAILDEAIATGLTEPASLHPVINESICMGSGACVAACPEHALGIVDGKAHLVNPSHCIGHGACAAACPVEGIKLVFGTEKRGIDIPHVKPNFETNVPGIFIAGELGGMGLVRKAAEQGRQAMQSIAARRAGSADELDVVIVGAGPAGLAATLGAMEKKLRFVTLEQEDSLGGTVYHYPRNKIVMTQPVKLPLVGEARLGEISKESLLTFWQGIVDRTHMPLTFNERVERVEPEGNGFTVVTEKSRFRTHNVLLALGRRGTPRKLGVPGESLPKVVYRLIDPEQYRQQRVLVVGGGDSAIEAALAITNEPGTTVTLSYRGEAFGRIKPKNRDYLDTAQRDGKLTVMLNSQPASISPDAVTLKLADGEISLLNDAVIVCAGGILPMPMLKQVGIEVETKYGTE